MDKKGNIRFLKLSILVFTFVFFNMLYGASSENITSTYTALEGKECKVPGGKFKKMFEGDEYVDEGGEECPGFKSWRVFVRGFDSRSWVELYDGSQFWSTENLIFDVNVLENGVFPNVSGTKAEWRYTDSGKVKALIYRMSALSDAINGKSFSRLFVIKFTEKGEPKFCGIAKTNEEARTLASDEKKCTKSLKLIKMKTVGNYFERVEEY